MHCVNALLSNAINDCYTLLPSNSPLCSKYQQIIKKISPKWKLGTFFECIQTKQYFKREIQDQFIELFQQVRATYDLPWPDQPKKIIVPVWKAVGLLLDSIRVYQQFAYTE